MSDQIPAEWRVAEPFVFRPSEGDSYADQRKAWKRRVYQAKVELGYAR